MRLATLVHLAWADYRHETRLSVCAVLALTAVLAPLLVLFGLKYGLIATLTGRLMADPVVREIVPLGGGRYDAAAIANLAQRPEVAFVIGRTRQIAATADLLSAAGGQAVTVEMLPTAAGDPLLAGLPVPRDGEIVLSQTAAEKLGVAAGASVSAGFGRRRNGEPEYARTRLKVAAVLPLTAFSRDGLFAPLPLLEAVEDYRDGKAVPRFGWPGRDAGSAPRIYPGFRLYAKSLNDVEPLRRLFADRGQSVQTQADAIAQVKSLSRNLDVVFWIVAGLGVAGAAASLVASALAAVERKRRELSVLRLLGFSAAELVAYPVAQALFSGGLGIVLAFVGYFLAQFGLNQLFAERMGEAACRLLFWHALVAIVLTLACAAAASAAGGVRAARIEPSEGLRDV